jgi:transcriptional regulator with XRE-family HTH domain
MHGILSSVKQSMHGALTVNRLAEWLQGEIDGKGWSRRAAARKTKVSYTALTAILDGTTKVPGLSNLDKLAKTFGTPLVRLVEYCDYDLGFSVPNDRDRYIAQLIARQPEYRDAVEDFLALSQADFEAVVKHIEALRLMHERGERQSDPGD